MIGPDPYQRFPLPTGPKGPKGDLGEGVGIMHDGWNKMTTPTKTERFSAQVVIDDSHQAYNSNIPEIEYKAKLANQLAHSLFKNGYIRFDVDVNPGTMMKTLRAEIDVAPGRDYTIMVSDYVFYSLDKVWEYKEVEKALLNTFPERFL